MRWTPGEESPDIEDRRNEGGGGGGGGFGFGPRHLGIGGFVVLLILSVVFKRNFFSMLGGGSANTRQPTPIPGSQVAGAPAGAPANYDRTTQLVSFVLDDVQKTWTQEFAKRNQTYEHAKLVLFTDGTRSGCGEAESATGPFYCPQDHKVYIDLGFFQELKDRFGAPGEFAEAYVLAHEMGHHVQNLLGIEENMRRQQGAHPSSKNELSVKLELQADCLAGVWAHATAERGIVENGDIQSALKAAAAVGDDRLQKMATGTVHPESWTHGSSAQREHWFQTGYDSGNLDSCDTFGSR